MIDEKLLEAVKDIASARKKKRFPLLESDYSIGDVQIICEAFLDLSKAILKEKK